MHAAPKIERRISAISMLPGRDNRATVLRMTSRLYHAVVLAGISAVGAGVANAGNKPTTSDMAGAQHEPTTPLHTKLGARATPRFDAAAEADAGWHPTK